MITENLSTLKIHKLTQEQYNRELESGNIEENAIYLTPNEEMEPMLPLAGGTMTGVINSNISGVGAGYRSTYRDDFSYKDVIEVAKPNGVRIFTIRTWNSADSNKVDIGLSNSNNDAPSGLTIVRYENGTYDVRVGNNKILFGQHNKPSGSYTGNDTSSRSIAIGGFGTLFLYNTYYKIWGFVTAKGFFWSSNQGGESITGYDADITFINGTLLVNASELNASGQTYYYQVL